jgi:hypothetical protein
MGLYHNVYTIESVMGSGRRRRWREQGCISEFSARESQFIPLSQLKKKEGVKALPEETFFCIE